MKRKRKEKKRFKRLPNKDTSEVFKNLKPFTNCIQNWEPKKGLDWGKVMFEKNINNEK